MIHCPQCGYDSAHLAKEAEPALESLPSGTTAATVFPMHPGHRFVEMTDDGGVAHDVYFGKTAQGRSVVMRSGDMIPVPTTHVTVVPQASPPNEVVITGLSLADGLVRAPAHGSSLIVQQAQAVAEMLGSDALFRSATGTSAANTAQTLTITGVANKDMITYGLHVYIRAATAGADGVVDLNDDTAGTTVFSAVIGSGAPTGSMVGFEGLKFRCAASGDAVEVVIPAMGAGVITEATVVAIEVPA